MPSPGRLLPRPPLPSPCHILPDCLYFWPDVDPLLPYPRKGQDRRRSAEASICSAYDGAASPSFVEFVAGLPSAVHATLPPASAVASPHEEAWFMLPCKKPKLMSLQFCITRRKLVMVLMVAGGGPWTTE
ncbi:hypothetical protein BS78_10G090400 [Paspalum vaginatum]|nr:hypothetical protein BS78_10G090400 [Paspalum vaginatum]